jgi:protein involved in polysaccharide export with SLBB domain
VCALVAAVVAAALGPAPAAAQAGRAPAAGATASTGPFATRAQLQAALADAERRRATSEATRIRQRLTNGDFRAGDRLVLTIMLDSTSQSELVVRDSQRVDLPPLGSTSLYGVLRSEARPAMLRFLQKYYRNPDVRVEPLVRVGFTGAVAKPGFYSVPPDAPLADVLVSAAGGPVGSADIGKIEVRRGQQRVVDRDAYKRAARDGITVADAGVVSGDEVRVPERKNRSTGQVVQTLFWGVSAVTSLIFLIRTFYTD